MANTSPSIGYIRIDDSDPNFKYNGEIWAISSQSIFYNGSCHYLLTEGTTEQINSSNVTFYFYGSKLKIISMVYPTYSSSAVCEIDGIAHTFSHYNATQIAQTVVFDINNLNISNHKVKIYCTDGKRWQFDAIDIDTGGRMISESEYSSRFLIKQNNKIYTVLNSQLSEITEPITYNVILENGIDIQTLNNNINLFENNFYILTSLNKQYCLNGIKSNLELIVQKSDFVTAIQENVDFIKTLSILSGSGNIKLVFSIDSGITWKTHNGTSFTDLAITIPQKTYSELTPEELIQWNNARDTIYNNGISSSILETLDFNILNMSKIRFALILYVESYNDIAQLQNINWQFDAKPSYKVMKDSEIDIEFLNNSIKITPLINVSEVKVNVVI